VHYLIHYQGPDAPDRRRFAKLCAAAAVSAGILGCLPWPGGIAATGVVDYDPIASIRAASPGFLQTLHVHSGQTVHSGAPLVTIANPQTEMELTNVRIAAEQAEIRARIMQDEGDVAGYQVEKRHLESLAEQERELAQKVASLQLSAPTEGRVIGRELKLLQNQYLASGAEILAIGNDRRKSILVAVPQTDVEYFLNQVGTRVRIRVAGQGMLRGGGMLLKVNPRASQQLFHPALAAAYGGPLPVTMNSEPSSAESNASATLVDPHFRATVELTPEQANRLRAGQLVRIRLTAGGRTVASHLWNVVESWAQNKLKTF
jgi:multidrug efflux pump subunit AcrA (membrane-fusion protein)